MEWDSRGISGVDPARKYAGRHKVLTDTTPLPTYLIHFHRFHLNPGDFPVKVLDEENGMC